MFLNDFSKEGQTVFLNLAYTLMQVDGKLESKEKEVFQAYKTEMGNGMLIEAKVVDYNDELAKLGSISDSVKRKIYFELLALAKADSEYAESEKSLMNIVQERFSLSDQIVNQMDGLLDKISDVYRELAHVLK